MAGMTTPAAVDLEPGPEGPLGPRARSQYRALAEMRIRLLVNSLRSNRGVFELGARAVSWIIYALIGLGVGAAAGALAYAIVLQRGWQYLAMELLGVSILWPATAVALASFEEQFHLEGLVRFPVSFGSFVLLGLIFGLFDVSTIIGGLCSLGLLAGIALARPELFGWSLTAVAGMALFNILLVRAILAWLDRWLQRRRSREIMTCLFVLGILSLQLMNPALRRGGLGDDAGDRPAHGTAASRVAEAARPWLEAGRRVVGWLPPGLAVQALRAADGGSAPGAARPLGAIGLYILCAGGLLAVRMRAEYRGENLGEAPRRERMDGRESRWLIGGAGPVGAVFEKELRTLLRSMPQLYGMIVPMVMVLAIANIFAGHHGSGRLTGLALPVSVAYGQLGFVPLIYNNLGAEGTGVQLLLLSPVPMRTVLLAKNLFHGTVFLVVALGAGLLAGLRLEHPGATAIGVAAAWLAFALPANLAAGNILSLTMAYRVNPGRIGRQTGSQANALLSMLVQTTLLGLGAAIIALCALAGRLWLAAPTLGGMAVAAVIAWMVVLGRADRIALGHREALLARLVKSE